MYLSKVELDLKNRSVLQAIRDCEDMHRNVQLLFNSTRQENNVLYRVHASKTKMMLYVQSDQQPKESAKSRENGMRITGSRDLGTWLSGVKKGDVVLYNLLAFPSKKCYREYNSNSFRKALITEEEKRLWWDERASNNGMQVLSALLKKEKTYSSKKKNFYFSGTEFTGTLVVKDAELFKQAVAEGIGPEKAYGMGLLLLLR